MARKARAEVAGGLYHVITRGNNRRPIFNEPGDYEKFLVSLSTQKRKLPFYLYAYCLMTNHVHLLIERQADPVGRIMHRVLTGYSQYYNRRYRRVGHLLQGRHKSILCQSERYLAELVRYIHLNPVRANMVKRPEQYKYSGHRDYLGMETAGIVDVDPVLRHFGASKELALKGYRQFVAAGMKLGHRDELYAAEEGRILGTEEFVDATIHRLGETKVRPHHQNKARESGKFEAQALIQTIEEICRISRKDFVGSQKNAAALAAKEALILTGIAAGATMSALAEITGLSSSTVSRRNEVARRKLRESSEMSELVRKIERQYRKTL